MITYTSGDSLLTQAQTLAFGYNAKGRSEKTPLSTTLLYQQPAAFATFGKQRRGDKLKPGKCGRGAFAMGCEGIAFIQQLDGFAGYMIDKQGWTTLTSGFAALSADPPLTRSTGD
jgi:hypothetical protein